MKRLTCLFSLVFLSACTLTSPYTITFTTPEDSSVNPQEDTLDLVLNHAAFAYLSHVDCGEAFDILPIIKDGMEPATVHNLSLEALVSQPNATECDVTVTAFDQTTTSSAQKEITLVVDIGLLEEETPVEETMPEAPVEAPTEEQVACEDSGGTWNECGSACEEGEICIQVCVPKCEYPAVEEEESTTPEE